MLRRDVLLIRRHTSNQSKKLFPADIINAFARLTKDHRGRRQAKTLKALRDRPPMKAEMRFVLDCCAPRSGIAPPCVPSHLDWDVVITAARRHQVLPLVAARVEQLETAGFQSPPPQALRTLCTSA